MSNCQAQFLAPFCEYAFQDCSCDYIVCHNVNSPDKHAMVEKYLEESKGKYQLVIALPLGPEWLSISKEALTARFGRDRMFFIVNLFFSGTHPDLSTLGDLTTRVMSPMGTPHSRIALGGWVAGLKESEIIALFNQKSIEKIGYYKLFDESANELRARERHCDTQFSDNLVNLSKMSFCFYTNNHPTPNLLAHYVTHFRRILVSREQARSSGLPLNAMQAAQTLAPSGIWPVYPELQPILAPDFPVSTLFILPDLHIGSELISREIFVQRSLALYEDMGRDKIAAFRQAQDANELLQPLL
jgi:hypothetical protein